MTPKKMYLIAILLICFAAEKMQAVPLRFLSLDGTEEIVETRDPDFLYALERGEKIHEFVQRILSSNEELVFIKDVFTESDAFELYQLLRTDFEYFFYIPRFIDLEEEIYVGGLLLASKSPIEDIETENLQILNNMSISHRATSLKMHKETDPFQ